VLARRGDEALKLGFGQRGGALRALGVHAPALGVPARVPLNQREVQGVGVQAANRGKPTLKRLGRNTAPSDFGWARYSAR
jgi:hypothetical protein